MCHVSSFKSHVLSFKGNVDETMPYAFVPDGHANFLRRMFDIKSLMHDVKRDMFDMTEVFTPAK